MANVPVDHLGLVIHELPSKGGRTRFLVALTHGTADRMPNVLLLTDPTLPSIRPDELTALEEATALIVSEARIELGAPIWPEKSAQPIPPPLGAEAIPPLKPEPCDQPPPISTPVEDAKPLPIKLGEEGEEPIVWGVTKKIIRGGQYRVVKALLEAHPSRLSTDQLARRSDMESPVKMIDRLRRDQDWADALSKPGQAHGGYGLNLWRPRPKAPGKR